MSSQVSTDKKKLKESLDRLWEIYKDIGQTVNKVSQLRCPYKNKDDYCTALFGCRYQLYKDGKDKPALCTGSDKLNYRSAWETE